MNKQVLRLNLAALGLIATVGCGPGIQLGEDQGASLTLLQSEALTSVLHTKSHIKLEEEGLLTDQGAQQEANKQLSGSLFQKNEEIEKSIEAMKERVKTEAPQDPSKHFEEMKTRVLEQIERLEAEIKSTDDEQLRAIHEKVLASLKQLLNVVSNQTAPPHPDQVRAQMGEALPSLDPELEARIKAEIEERRKQIEQELANR